MQTYNETFLENWEFNPVTEAEAKVIGDRLLQIADPKLIKLVMKGDDIAGFLFGFPDISEGIRRANGRIWPFGWFHLLRDMKRTKWINLNGAGILAPYRGLGVNAILYVEMEKNDAQRRLRARGPGADGRTRADRRRHEDDGRKDLQEASDL